MRRPSRAMSLYLLALLPFSVAFDGKARHGPSLLTTDSTCSGTGTPISVPRAARIISEATSDRHKILGHAINRTLGPPVTSLFVFGDSFWDTGNNKFILKEKPLARVPVPPYGLDYKPGSGRASNGRLMIDFLASYLGFEELPPNLQPGVNASRGLNFASCFASATDATKDMGISLSEQLAYFHSFRNDVMSSSASQSNPNYPPPEIFSSALYIISIGANDYFKLAMDLNASSSSSSQPRPSAAIAPLHAACSRTPKLCSGAGGLGTLLTVARLPRAVRGLMRQIVGNISLAATDLLHSGARRLLITGVTAIGCAPIIRQAFRIPESQPGKCAAAVNALGLLHNRLMRGMVARLRRQHPSAVILEGYGLLQGLQRQRQLSGTADVGNACCGAPPPRNALVFCGADYTFSNGTTIKSAVCSNRTDHLFFDFLHPSERSHRMFAQGLWSGGIQDVQPHNLEWLVRTRP